MSLAHYDPVADVLTIALAQPSQAESVESLKVDRGVFCDGGQRNAVHPWQGILRVRPFSNGFEAEKRRGNAPPFQLEQDFDGALIIAVLAHLEAA